jgi:hypothetical protein
MTTNRLILVDNATLSGVERLTGESQTLNLNNVENDILCLEKLLTAILFSDAIIGVADYKYTFRSQRLKKFDFIDFQKIEAETYRCLLGMLPNSQEAWHFCSMAQSRPGMWSAFLNLLGLTRSCGVTYSLPAST